MKKFIVEKKNVGKRLDVFLAESLMRSRSKMQKMIKEEKVKVNGKPNSVHYKLKYEDVVEVERRKKIVKKIPKELVKKIKVIGESDNYLVINKPAGLIVHPASDPELYTLVDWLLEYCPQIGQVGDSLIRPGIMHRLDKEVSGLMVIAKTQDSFDDLKKQFKERTISKQYQTLVYGSLTKDEDVIRFHIERSRSGKMAARPQKQPGKTAITEFSTIKKFINYTLLKVILKTGRTHQIRVHMAAYAHPIVGDNLYSTKVTRERNRKFDLGRVFLVATRLAFIDLSGKEQVFELSLPIELKKILKEIK